MPYVYTLRDTDLPMPGWPTMTTAFACGWWLSKYSSADLYSPLIKMPPFVKEIGNPWSTSNVAETSTSSRQSGSRWTVSWQIGFLLATQRSCQNAITSDDNHINISWQALNFECAYPLQLHLHLDAVALLEAHLRQRISECMQLEILLAFTRELNYNVEMLSRRRFRK